MSVVKEETTDDKNRYCTIVFECDIRKIQGNPFYIDTTFGRPIIISKGDKLSDTDHQQRSKTDDEAMI